MDLPNPGIEPGPLALQADSLPAELPGKPEAIIFMSSWNNKYLIYLIIIQILLTPVLFSPPLSQKSLSLFYGTKVWPYFEGVNRKRVCLIYWNGHKRKSYIFEVNLDARNPCGSPPRPLKIPSRTSHSTLELAQYSFPPGHHLLLKLTYSSHQILWWIKFHFLFCSSV